jgi:hypothetical protein
MAHAWHTIRPQPLGKSSNHREEPSPSSDPLDDNVLVDRRLFLGDVPVIASRSRRSSVSISSKLSGEWSVGRRLDESLGDGVAEKQRSGVGGVDTAASVQVRAHTEHVAVSHLPP